MVPLGTGGAHKVVGISGLPVVLQHSASLRFSFISEPTSENFIDLCIDDPYSFLHMSFISLKFTKLSAGDMAQQHSTYLAKVRW